MIHEHNDQPALFDTGSAPRLPFDICSNRHKQAPASVEANPSQERKSEMHKKILAYMNFIGRTWLKDLCRELGKEKNEISGRLSELKAMGLIYETGEREEKCAVLKVSKS